MTPARQARVLRRWIATLGLPALPGRGLTRILTDLLHADPDSEATFAWAHARVVRWRDVLHADWQPRPWTAPWMLPWDGRAVLQLPGNGGRLMLCAHAITPFLGFDRQLIVRPRAGGERIVLPGRIHSHSLKHVLQSLGVPPWERARMPLLSDDEGNVHAAGDLAFSAQFDAWLLKQTAHLQWIPADMAARVFTRQGRPCNPPAF